MAIGALASIAPGAQFKDRRALYDAGVHRVLQAGIVGSAATGAESIVLSGGYIDDEDHGDEIIYTGHGGRDPATGRQNADQTFTRQNQALVVNCLEGLPVRVVRGSEHVSPYSPRAGYRYDGLYHVDRYWHERGRDGYLICRFRLLAAHSFIKEALGQAEGGGTTGSSKIGPASRQLTTILRIIRDTAIAKEIKRRYGYACQVCGIVLACQGGPYAEAAHIRPLGSPHDGSDELANLLCLCPNHHVLFDNGAFSIGDDLSLIGMPGRLSVRSGHVINYGHLAYNRLMWGR